MQAGKRDQPIYFEYPTDGNNRGELTTTWTDASGDSPPSPDWAYVISQKGSESFEAARINARDTIRLMVIYREDVKTTWRLRWMDQTYFIKAVDRSGQRKNELWITAELTGAQ